MPTDNRQPVTGNGCTRSPWAFVPTAYFVQGLPFVLVNTTSVLLYKDLGLTNAFIGYTSSLYLPWVLKPLWSPLLELRGSRRGWILGTQVTLAALFLLLALVLQLPGGVALSAGVFVLIGLVSATHDVALDGFYLLALESRAQALFTGIRSTAYRLATIFGSGLLAILAGDLIEAQTAVPLAWGSVFLLGAVLLGLLAAYHAWALPRPAQDRPALRAGVEDSPRPQALEVVLSYFRQPGVGVLIAFILLFRLGEALMGKMLVPFLKDAAAAGGLGFTTHAVGVAYGTCGILGLVAGGILGGTLIARLGLRRCLWPLVLCIHLPNLIFVYLAWAQGQPPGAPGFALVTSLITLEQFGYGMGYAVFTVVLLRATGPRFPTAHYALSTGFMALGMMLPGMASGYLQGALGYFHFFTLACLLTIPGMLVIPRLRLGKE